MTTDKNGEITFPKWFVWLAGIATPLVATWMAFVSMTLWELKATVQTGVAVHDTKLTEHERRIVNLEIEQRRQSQ